MTQEMKIQTRTSKSRHAFKMAALLLSLTLLGSAHARISKPPPFVNSKVTPDPTVSPAPTVNPTSRPTVSVSPSNLPSTTPTSLPTSVPTVSLVPTVKKSHLPSAVPTDLPTEGPTGIPSVSPTTSSPTFSPTVTSSTTPTSFPTAIKSSFPTSFPTITASDTPTLPPIVSPSIEPTSQPSGKPTSRPTLSQSTSPSSQPTVSPTTQPTSIPSSPPTSDPSAGPTSQPTSSPSAFPSASPTTASPTTTPTAKPSLLPSSSPTMVPTTKPSASPSDWPSALPSMHPTDVPSLSPSQRPSDPNIEVHNSTLTIGFEHFISPMDKKEEGLFQGTLRKFMTKNMKEPEAVTIDIASVEITSQLKEPGVANGLLSYSRKLDEKRKDGDDLPSSGLKVEVLVVGLVTRGSPLPPTFSFGDTITEALTKDFDSFMNELDGSFIENGVDGGPRYDMRPSDVTFPMFTTLIAVGCGVGGMIIAAGFVFVHNKRQKRRRMAQYQNQCHHQMNQDLSPEVMLQDPYEFARNNQAIYKSPFDEEAGNSYSHRWEWEGGKSTSDVKSSKAIIAYSEDEQSEQSSAYELEGQRDLASAYSASRSDSMSSVPSSRNIDTPTESVGSASLGINLSPEALIAAERQGQQFSFVPREANASLGQVYPGTQHQYSHPGMNRRLAYKTVVSYAPPGPLGVIIDTTAEGPMVHSIKPTSAMLGSLAPGDIVVGLDNIETRQMTAPALTRLMARKSQQPKRKITSLRPVMH